ncbi:DNA mismatch repair endonuclease MutL [Bengtsoniella intestinalis]|uniref:DNA mismatch repair endonuclease MutL n=1 Tax=Bengtsoniella intestinalis TaxID=3073143 RepID=UPI00391F2A2B
MPIINQLPAHLSDLIAAGEVVERPASVVKELVENAIDAGATTIAVDISRGGMGRIRITDNGCGIAPTELPTAFLRHATSKLHTAEDLGAIATLGFRGEALAAICAVSRLEITSCQKGESQGASLFLEGGVPQTVETVGAPQGTTICVEDLFYNTPARLKFMRKDSAETAAISGLMQQLSLSHPDLSFRLKKDGQETLQTAGDGKLQSAIYGALGADFAKTLVPVKGSGDGISVEGFVTQPLKGRGSRGMQFFFVNGRLVKSALMTSALEEGYRAQLMKGRFPGCVLHITLPVELVDVNVHPAKTQVKFAKEKAVFDAVFYTVLDCLAKSGGAVKPAQTIPDLTAILPKTPQGAVPVSPKVAPKTTATPKETFRTMDSATYRQEVMGEKPSVMKKSAGLAPVRPVASNTGESTSKKPTPWNQQWTAKPVTVAPPHPMWDSEVKPAVSRVAEPERHAPIPYATKADKVVEQQAPPPVVEVEPVQETLLTAPWRYIGEVGKTYILSEGDDGSLWLIDKHAAHERMHYNRLMAEGYQPMTQQMLCPVAASMSPEDSVLLLSNVPTLQALGFEMEDFGDGSVVVSAVPSDVAEGDVVATLEELTTALRSGQSKNRQEELYHVMACKAAMKAGMITSDAELQALVERVQSGEIRYCPHGRPIAVEMTAYQLEKLFKRA